MAVFFSDDVTHVAAPIITNSTSRYKSKLRISLKEGTTKVRFIRKRDLDLTDDNSSIHVVQGNEAFRPDIIANQYYGDEKYAWIILAANNMKVPYDLQQGMKIVIPSLVPLQGAQGKLVTR